MKKFIVTMIMVVMMSMSFGMTTYANAESEENVKNFMKETENNGREGCKESDEIIFMGSYYKEIGYGYYKVEFIIYDIPAQRFVRVGGIYKGFDDELMDNTLYLLFGDEEIDVKDKDALNAFMGEHPELVGI